MSRRRVAPLPGCAQAARHWFTYFGWVGSSAPTCQRCGAPNPHYDADRDPKAVR